MFDNLSDRLQSIFSGLTSKGHLTEEDVDRALKEIRMALLEADVNFKVVKEFTANVKEAAIGADVYNSLTPGQTVIKVVLDQLTQLLGSTDSKLVLSGRIPNVIMLVGLQGSGKTTSAAKLALYLRKQKRQPLLVAGDVYRPAAADQLEALGKELDIPVYRGDGKDPVAIAKEGVKQAVDTMRDVVIIDTAGRLHVDEEMMTEAVNIRNATRPDQILMVVDAMTGQDAVNVAKEFSDKVDFDGVIMSKMDGDARGGAALSIREVTGKPIKFISAGEKPDSLEVFHPDRMAKRILGMGDMVTLIEKAVETNEQEISEQEAERFAKAQFDLNDFLKQIKQIRKMGGIGSILKSLPGMKGKMPAEGVDEKQLDVFEAMVFSMTPEERANPKVLNGSRRERIAAGSGVSVQEINRFIKQFNDAKKMMKQFTNNGKGKKGRRGGRPSLDGFDGFPGM